MDDTEVNATLCQIRLICKEGDRGSLHVKSNLDSTYQLDHRTDEAISFTDQDLVAIQNKRESPCQITLQSVRLPDGRFAILRPGRQPHQKLFSREDSISRSELKLTLGGGETLMLHTSLWAPRAGSGAVFPV